MADSSAGGLAAPTAQRFARAGDRTVDRHRDGTTPGPGHKRDPIRLPSQAREFPLPARSAVCARTRPGLAYPLQRQRQRRQRRAQTETRPCVPRLMGNSVGCCSSDGGSTPHPKPDRASKEEPTVPSSETAPTADDSSTPTKMAKMGDVTVGDSKPLSLSPEALTKVKTAR